MLFVTSEKFRIFFFFCLFLAEANLNKRFFQGDMMLTHGQQIILNKAFKLAEKRTDLENRAMIKDMARLWPGGVVLYTYASDLGKKQK